MSNALSRHIERREKLVHLGEVPVDDVLPYVTATPSRRTYTVAGRNYDVKMSSPRLVTFKENRSCVVCGLVGTKVLLDLSVDTEQPHFNLYAEQAGRLVLMTQDHIQPRSQGGTSEPSNLRTACAPCNNIRGADVNVTDAEVLRLRALWPDMDAIAVARREMAGATLPLVKETVDESSLSAMAWALVRYAYAITSALAMGSEARAFDAAKKAQVLLGKVLSKLKEKMA